MWPTKTLNEKRRWGYERCGTGGYRFLTPSQPYRPYQGEWRRDRETLKIARAREKRERERERHTERVNNQPSGQSQEKLPSEALHDAPFLHTGFVSLHKSRRISQPLPTYSAVQTK